MEPADDAADDLAPARALWLVGEPIHALTYFAQPAFDAWAAAGITGFWRGYFATRSAPFGAVGPEVVTAAFYNFDPAMVARALPSVWELASPAAALEARLAGADAALRDVVGEEGLGDPRLPAVVTTLQDAVAGAPVVGRALFGANVSLPWPSVPHLAVWHGLTCLREHRGDGHNAALLAAGIDGCQAHVLAGAAGGAPREVLQPARGWSDERWDRAVADLAERGILDEAGLLTDAGRLVHLGVEGHTDQLAALPWSGIAPERIEELVDTLLPWTHAIEAAGTIRQPNPMGLPPLPAMLQG